MNLANAPTPVRLRDGTVLSVPMMSMDTILRRLQPWVEERHRATLAGMPVHAEMSPDVRMAVARANADLARRVPPPGVGSPDFHRLLNSTPEGAGLHLQCCLAACHPEHDTPEAGRALLAKLTFMEYMNITNAGWLQEDEGEGEGPKPGETTAEEQPPTPAG
jgi:hypothetical protein